MNNLAWALAATVALLGNAPLAIADTVTTTTVETTTNAPALVLPSGNTYVAVDLSGNVIGTYDYTTRLIDGRPVPTDSYIIEKSTGKVYATSTATGQIVAFSSVPTTLPQRFIVRDGAVYYLGSDYSARRSLIEAQINADFAAGHLSSRNVKELQDELASIAALESKRRSDGTFKSSTTREIERKFAHVQSEYSEDVAEINSKRAKIGLQNN